MYICIYVNMYICIYVYMYICIYVYVCIYICVCVRVCSRIGLKMALTMQLAMQAHAQLRKLWPKLDVGPAGQRVQSIQRCMSAWHRRRYGAWSKTLNTMSSACAEPKAHLGFKACNLKLSISKPLKITIFRSQTLNTMSSVWQSRRRI